MVSARFNPETTEWPTHRAFFISMGNFLFAKLSVTLITISVKVKVIQNDTWHWVIFWVDLRQDNIFPESSLGDKELVSGEFRRWEYCEEGGAPFCKGTKTGFVCQAEREETQHRDPVWVQCRRTHRRQLGESPRQQSNSNLFNCWSRIKPLDRHVVLHFVSISIRLSHLFFFTFICSVCLFQMILLDVFHLCVFIRTVPSDPSVPLNAEHWSVISVRSDFQLFLLRL